MHGSPKISLNGNPISNDAASGNVNQTMGDDEGRNDTLAQLSQLSATPDRVSHQYNKSAIPESLEKPLIKVSGHRQTNSKSHSAMGSPTKSQKSHRSSPQHTPRSIRSHHSRRSQTQDILPTQNQHEL